MAGGDKDFERLTTYDYDVALLMAYADELPREQYEELAGIVSRIDERQPGYGSRVYVSGEQPARNEAYDQLAVILVTSLMLAVPAVALVMILTLGSARLAALSLLPNLLPIVVGLGFLALVDISLRSIIVGAFPIAFGIAVDDTIHFLTRYQRELADGNSTERAVEASILTVGRPMILSTVFLVGGCFLYGLASYVTALEMGVTIIVVLVAALVGDLLLLPALLICFDRAPRQTDA